MPSICRKGGSNALAGQMPPGFTLGRRRLYQLDNVGLLPTWRAVPDIDPRRRDAELHPRGRDMSAGGCVGANALAAESKPNRSSWRRFAHPSFSTASNTRSLLEPAEVLASGSGGVLVANCSSRRRWSWICAKRFSLVRLAAVQVSGHGAHDDLGI